MLGDTKQQKYTITGTTLKGSNQGLTKIPIVPKAKTIQKLFLSNNDITSLEGIENYTNLQVLSLGCNQISKLSDIRYLEQLPLQNLQLECNPLTHLPYYSHLVVSSIPSLLMLDGQRIDETIRQRAISTHTMDIQMLDQLCANDLKITELEQFIQDIKNPGQQFTQAWFMNVKKALNASSIQDYDITEEEKIERYDILREQALQEKETSKKKWSDIYKEIDNIQCNVISNYTEEITVFLQDFRNKLSKSPKSSASTPQRDSFLLSKTQRISPSPQPRSPLIIEEEPYSSVPLFFSRLVNNRLKRSVLKAWRGSSIKRDYEVIAEKFYKSRLEKVLLQSFYRWRLSISRQVKNQEHIPSSSSQRPKKLVINKTISIGISSKRNIPSTPENIELLEEAQRLSALVSELQTQLDMAKEEAKEATLALEESVKRETKAKNECKRYERIAKDCENHMKQTEKRYEDEVLQLMLQQRLKYDGIDKKTGELEKENQNIKMENEALNAYIKEMKEKSELEINDLKQKLNTAFEVAGGLRKKVSKLSMLQTPSPVNKPSDNSMSPTYGSPAEQGN
ncbi:Leucine Rich Repeat family protein [Trichomonas vaginalis G3]|uniref:Leucine Rich Repeat family protein n=1 Tax=Trichomonas vaginalis (strain ATCC PRA-98 / G3) TaxID=412133 RepID=A2FTV3_TRIV3|nr:uncharacterized protein TVAGG3_0951470 [Trichomonas vaginalis G3]EAX91674.1 Leucine Rich Repeat family protein [Trichomonas vaginalis G3]KAI5487252.1 L domain-like family [Trichomonas vaginalis G3]|eukprot:XP_001304604.1 hypothetical protein [Trichomonas vaginalis G3]